MINKSRLLQLIFLLFIYTVSKDYFYKINPEIYLLFKIVFLSGILFATGIIHSLYTDFKKTVDKNFSDKNTLKDRLVILLFWAFAVVTVKNVGFFSETISSSIIVFIAFLPLLWLVKPSFTFLTKFSLILLLFTAIFSSGYRPTAEIFAELTFFWLFCSVIMKVKQNA